VFTKKVFYAIQKFWTTFAGRRRAAVRGMSPSRQYINAKRITNLLLEFALRGLTKKQKNNPNTIK